MYAWTAVLSVGVVAISLQHRSAAVWVVAVAVVLVGVLTLWPVRMAPSRIGGAEADVVDRGPDGDG